MAKGGYRAAAGRPKGTGKKKGLPGPPDVGEGVTPLEYMLAVIRNPAIDVTRRDRMAIAAAPYCHPRISDQRPSKRDLREEAARTAALGTEWGDDLLMEKWQ
jgi:phage terminase small subunit